MEIFDKDGKDLSVSEVLAMLPQDHIRRIIWDSPLTAQYQDEHWSDIDMCDLIMKKLLNNSPIDFATGGLKEKDKYGKRNE
jgi:hypothetical protein